MSDHTLGAALRDLAPEPPDELGRPETARRRAGAVRRRRYAAVTAMAVLAVVAGAGVLATRREEPVRPVRHPIGDAYPDWPRRGDAPPSVDAEAIAAYARWVPTRGDDVRLHGTPRVLYAGGDPTVVVMHAVLTRGGERFVVLTREAGRLTVWSDTYAPPPVPQTLTVLLGGTVPPYFDDRTPCSVDPLTDPASPVRLLVLAPPSKRYMAMRVVPIDDSYCPGDEQRERRSTGPVVLTDGVARVDPDLGPRGQLIFEGGTYQVDYPHHVAYGHGPISIGGGGGGGPLGWQHRWDGSRAVDLHETLWRAAELLPQGGGCAPFWYASLPDGTPAAFCLTADRYAVIGAEGADRQVRTYVEQRVRGQDPDRFAAVVDGFDGRWLVYVGPHTVTRAELVDGARRVEIPLRDGYGFLRMDREPSERAVVRTPEREVPVHTGPARVLARRR